MLKNILGLKVSVCQINVVPGRPDINTDYIIEEIKQAAERGVDIITFPEMAVPGYIIGDLYEDVFFVNDVLRYNEKIREATSVGITAIFGSILTDDRKNGEDGRTRKHNTAFIAQDGKWTGCSIKTLQPNYRIFDDDRYFFSLRKVIEEKKESPHRGDNSFIGRGIMVDNSYTPSEIETRAGLIKIGVILCEDMWHDDYVINPSLTLAGKGAEIIFNLSASPWSWQKNRKRHQVVKDLLYECHVPFVYTNNAGIQNNGKNIVVFDGSSAIYDAEGKIVFEVAPYETGSYDFTFSEDMPEVKRGEQDDVGELYSAVARGIKGFLDMLPPAMRKVFIGLSGGIDSALSAALFTIILGKENVKLINMPSKYNSNKIREVAEKIAKNLGANYSVHSIQEIVDAIAEEIEVKQDTLVYENIQARSRMEILAAIAQKNNGVFSANWNKTEAAFGYGTLYGDMAGFIAPLGDLTKREVYQLADYVNRVIFKRLIIPEECFEMDPTAELGKNQKDPFHYGKLNRRGYHDEMVRAFVVFRLNPEWFLEKYLKGDLDSALKLEKGTINVLFPDPEDFIKDLEKNWERFHKAYFKRVQGAPIPIVSKRAFGADLRESILPPHLTLRYYELKKEI